MLQQQQQTAGPELQRQLKDPTKVQRAKLTFPNIFMIGAMKAGTTSLTELLRENVAICPTGEKEKHFFSGGDYDGKYVAELNRYRAEFAGCKPGQLTLDATPGYTADMRVPERIRESYAPAVLAQQKYLYILREPITRHYSEYQMNVRLCIDADEDLKRGNYMEWRIYRHERSCEAVMKNFNGLTNDPTKHAKAKVMTFHEWCLSEKGRLELRRGLYKEVIARYLKVISREQIFFINFDTLIQNTSHVMEGLNKFLNIPPAHHWNKTVKLPIPKKSQHRPELPTYMDCTTVKMLDLFFKRVDGDFFGWMKNLTLVTGRALGEPEFVRYTTNPFDKCVHKYNWTGQWSESNYWNVSVKSFPKETWTFVGDSIDLLKMEGALPKDDGVAATAAAAVAAAAASKAGSAAAAAAAAKSSGGASGSAVVPPVAASAVRTWPANGPTVHRA